MVEFTGSGLPMSQAGMDAASDAIGVKPAEMWAVISVETSGCGFLSDRRPKILFERHVFSRLTGHRYDADNPDISQPTAGAYGRAGAHQYDRLAAALQLDEDAALNSASWGLGQIMGENYAAAGYATVAEMVAAMVASEDNQLRAMANFLKSTGWDEPLRQHDWAGFAGRYNGPDYAAHNYDRLLPQFYQRYSTGPLPDLRVRAVQVYLGYKGFSGVVVDGIAGPATSGAVMAFQASVGAAQTGTIDDALLAVLSA